MTTSKNAINKRFNESVEKLTNSEQKINKKTIAENLNIKQSKFSEILNGRMSANPELIANFCLIYHIDINWILTGEYYNPGQKAKTINDPDQNKYTGNSEEKHLNEMNTRLSDENTLLREQISVLQEVIKDQRILIDAFKSGDIIVATPKESK